MIRDRGISTGVCAAVALAAGMTGCVAPSATTVRLPGGVRAGRGTFVVPAGWDYRASYRIPTDRLVKIVQSYIGTPYRRGGISRSGMDCSGFVGAVFRDLSRARLPRSTAQLKRLGDLVTIREARIGDLVFFRTGIFNTINHVGIHLGENRFAHASSTKGVIYSSLDSDYYRLRVAYARRLF